MGQTKFGSGKGTWDEPGVMRRQTLAFGGLVAAVYDKGGPGVRRKKVDGEEVLLGMEEKKGQEDNLQAVVHPAVEGAKQGGEDTLADEDEEHEEVCQALW